MKVRVTVVTLLAIVAWTEAGLVRKYVPTFLESFKQLHRGPVESNMAKGHGVAIKWMTQPLDHFDEQNKKTWQMRYLVNEQHFEKGGPMFIFLGGEWEISAGAIQNGLFPDLAKEHKAILFYTEHRYYGESQPTSNLTIENIQYLHVRQALADLANFIRTQRATDSRLANAKVIIAGCSYSATMVVWFKKLYPELVNGGWASSAPILAKVDFKEYNEVSGRAIRELGSQQCYDRIKNGIAELEAMFLDKRSAEAKAMLQLCNSFDHNNDLDLWSLFGTISNIFSSIVQYQLDGDIPYICDFLMGFEDDLTAVATFFLRSFSRDGCQDVTYSSNLNYLLNTSNEEGVIRAWFYQTCNEFGWYQSSASKDQPFGTQIPALLYTTICYDAFGSKYTNQHIHKLVAETNKLFGGMTPNVKNVYMSHGALDPWSAMGHNVTHGASVIAESSHCADMNSIDSSDSPEMLASKQGLVKAVREWLA